jgi:hypothetical protein
MAAGADRGLYLQKVDKAKLLGLGDYMQAIEFYVNDLRKILLRVAK